MECSRPPPPMSSTLSLEVSAVGIGRSYGVDQVGPGEPVEPVGPVAPVGAGAEVGAGAPVGAAGRVEGAGVPVPAGGGGRPGGGGFIILSMSIRCVPSMLLGSAGGVSLSMLAIVAPIAVAFQSGI